MIYILHGEDLPSIRNFILKIQQENNVGSKKEVRIEDISEGEVAELLASVDMFGDVLMVVLDITKMGRMKVDSYIDVLTAIPEDFVFVIFSDKKLSKTNAFIKNAPLLKAKVALFGGKDGYTVFKFSDLVFSGDKNGSYKELQKLILAGEDPIYIFSMLSYGLRNIAYEKFDSPAFGSLSPFVRSKVKSQSQMFSEEGVITLYDTFYLLDRGVKQGLILPELLPVYALEKVLTYIQ